VPPSDGQADLGRLTQAGRHARDRLTIALETVEFAIQAARHPAGVPVLRVGCVQLVGFGAMPGALAALMAQGALPEMSIVEAEALALLSALAEGELDCVIGWLDESIASQLDLDLFSIEPLWSGRMQVFASTEHPLARRRRVAAADLTGEPWVVPRQGSRTYAAFQRVFLNNGLAAPRPSVTCTSVHTCVHIVAAGGFVSIGPEQLVASYRSRLPIRALRGDELDTGRTQLSFFTPKAGARFAPAVRLKEALRARSDDWA